MTLYLIYLKLKIFCFIVNNLAAFPFYSFSDWEFFLFNYSLTDFIKIFLFNHLDELLNENSFKQRI